VILINFLSDCFPIRKDNFFKCSNYVWFVENELLIILIIVSLSLMATRLRHTALNSYYAMRADSNPGNGGIFGRCMGSVPIEHRNEYE
jgi:hypothetical protein